MMADSQRDMVKCTRYEYIYTFNHNNIKKRNENEKLQFVVNCFVLYQNGFIKHEVRISINFFTSFFILLRSSRCYNICNGFVAKAPYAGSIYSRTTYM